MSLAFSLALGEVVLRVWFPQVGKLRQLVVSTDDERGFKPRPNLKLPFEGVFETLSRSVVWQTNSDGFRHASDIGPTGDRFRIATFGDSETFGWSVPLEDSFQKAMEAIDPRVEVLNFGVPGYNVTNVRDHLERMVPRFDPDLVVYLVNKNDFNEAVQFTPLSYSHVLLHLRFLWHFSVGKALRRQTRDRDERLEMFASEAERMTRFLEARDTPFIMGFLKWENRKSVRDHAVAIPHSPSSSPFRRELIDVKAVLEGEPKEDTHYTRSAHLKIAALFCDVIAIGEPRAVGAQSEAGARQLGCVPPGWGLGAESGSRHRRSGFAAAPGTASGSQR